MGKWIAFHRSFAEMAQSLIDPFLCRSLILHSCTRASRWRILMLCQIVSLTDRRLLTILKTSIIGVAKLTFGLQYFWWLWIHCILLWYLRLRHIFVIDWLTVRIVWLWLLRLAVSRVNDQIIRQDYHVPIVGKTYEIWLFVKSLYHHQFPRAKKVQMLR